jgi:RNA-directed DNA polymerase
MFIDIPKVTHKQPYRLFESNFQINSLNKIYDEKFKSSKTKGIDRLSGIKFENRAKEHIRIIHKKCMGGTYKFSPYLELIQSKGRGKFPRVLAIPTVRDRIVLNALKNILFQIFPECVQRKLANTYIYDIERFTGEISPSHIGVYRTDIKNFYDSINREKLFDKLKTRIKSKKLLNLIKKAVERPVVPKNYNREDLKKYFNNKGIPQGLSISNILASIYLNDFDKSLEQDKSIDVYYRYVDDILVFVSKEKLNDIELLIENKMTSLDLQLNKDKTYKNDGNEVFEYLGYRFQLPEVTVRESTVEKFIQSLAAKFSNYIHNKKRILKKTKENNYGVDKLKDSFVLDLNEKITGAISENKRYGWIFYFNEITDMKLLHKIDNIIANFFKRLDDFNRIPPPNLKKISRAFFEAKYSPEGGYIHNYNKYESREQKERFLLERCKINRNEHYSDEKIHDLYEFHKRNNLSELEKDDALIYR